MSNFTREINRLLTVFLVAFGLMIIATTYYAIIGQETLLLREDNPRLVEDEQSILRGSIYDRKEKHLAETTVGNNEFATRTYFYPAMNSALGYYSYRYGTAGAEATFNDILSSNNIPPTFSELILNQPAQGIDIKLSFDLNVQQVITDMMQDYRGAVIVMTVPNGEILSLVSLPTYDPNTLDSDWETLIESDKNPFFNRAIQGRYQPGSLIQTPIMIHNLIQGQLLNAQFPTGSTSVTVDDLTISCVRTPPESGITLREAYLYGCPEPFTQFANLMSADALQNTFQLLRLEIPTGIDQLLPVEALETPITQLNQQNMRENSVGQGALNVSPIAMTLLTAAIINDGNAPRPKTLLATKRPGQSDWENSVNYIPTVAYTTAINARRITELLRESARVGTGSVTDWGTLDVGGAASIAYSGDSTQVWFTGFVVLESTQNAVVTVVLENTDDIRIPVEIGKAALQAVTESIKPQN